MTFYGQIEIPTSEQFISGYEQFVLHEKRDSMYKVATFLLEHFWGKYAEMADALGVLLLTWNQAFYRYGRFDFEKLEDCIFRNFVLVKSFRDRNIFSLLEEDRDDIEHLFNDFSTSLKIASTGKMMGRKSPVATAKALHLLAPQFFPLWDKKIADTYKQNYNSDPEKKYFDFCLITKYMAENIKSYEITSEKTIVKLIDEYNYSKYTKKWI